MLNKNIKTMKNIKLTLSAMMFACFFILGINNAQAQQGANVGQALAGLINVNIGAIQADVEIDDVLNDFTLVDVDDVLNNNNVEILNNVLNDSPIASNNSEILTNLLRDADIIDDVQVVVGVLSGGILLIQ
jgi:hypothetical protein